MDMVFRRLRLWILAAAAGVLLGVLCPGEAAAAQGKTVRIGVFELKGFYEKNKDGQPEGYGVDYLDKVAEITDWTYEYVWAESWDECVKLLRQNKVDLLAPAQITQERMAEFGFSSFSIGMECGSMLALSTNDKLEYEDFPSFDQIKIGCVDSFVFKHDFLQYAREKGFGTLLVNYKDTKALMAALNAGEVDAVLANLFVKTDTTKVLAKFSIKSFYYMLRKNDPLLQEELNEALQQINIEATDFGTNLMQKYYPSFNEIPFTKSERQYIMESPVLRVACRSDMRPVSFVDQDTGEIEGITRDILDEVGEKSGLRFEYVPLPEGEIDYDYFRDNEIDLISSVEYNKQNTSASGLRLTYPYLDSQKVFVCEREERFDVDQPVRLAVSTGSKTLVSAIHDKYPNMEVVVYKNLRECFEAVRRGEADALLENQYVVSTYLAKPLYSNMSTIPMEGLLDEMCISPVINRQAGIQDGRLSDGRLISVLNKSIQRISRDDVVKIVIQRTSEDQYQYTYSDFLYQYRYPIAVITVFLGIILVILYHLVRLRQRMLKMAVQNESRLRNITNNINGGVLVLTADEALRITYANEGFMELLNWERDKCQEIDNWECRAYVHPDDMGELKELMSLDINETNQVSFRTRIMRRDGSYIPTLFNGTLTENERGEREIYCVIMDISQQEQLIEQLSLEQEKYALLIENSGDIVFEVDCRRNHFIISPLFEKKFGWKTGSVFMQDPLSDILHLLKIYEEDREEVEKVAAKVFVQKTKMECQARIRRADSSLLWCRIFLFPMADAGGALVDVIGKILDINGEVLAMEALEQKSRIDGLTGLLNKAAFFAESRKYLESSPGKNTALIFIDVDNFKQINDRLGHMMGDMAIRETAKRLQVIFSNYDLISRFGGDEFCILLKEIPEDTLKDKLEWAVERLRRVYSENGETVSSSVSVGAACTYGERTELEVLIDQADKALYSAKENGKDRYVLYYHGLDLA